MKLSFLGATQTVTGSKYLITHEDRRYLIDCGLFQGEKELRLRNWKNLPIHANQINDVILTHAHIDHSGYVPLLVKQGFKGKIYCSQATYDLCRILLPDSGYLQEEDAARANRYGYSKHKPALPLYTEEDAKNSLEFFHPIDFGKPHALNGELSFTLSRAGHILGSSFIDLNDGQSNILFSGDLGRPNDPIMCTPATIQRADYIVVESTYGDRRHGSDDPETEMGRIISETVTKGGSVIIPSFAVGRTQTILYHLYQLQQKGQLANVPIYLDSPMAINATRLMHRHHNEHRLPPDLCQKVCDVANYVQTVEHSKQIDQSHMPSIIISASGMITGGRVLHHVKHHMGDPRNTILFVGFQAPGTRGDRILKGEKRIKIHGEMCPLRARVEKIDNLSAHADYEEILQWLSKFKEPPRKCFVTHGEETSAAAMKAHIEEKLGWQNVVIPTYQDEVDL